VSESRWLVLLVLSFAALVMAQTCSAHAQDLPAVPEVTLPALGETVPLEPNERAPWAGMLVRDEDLFALQSTVMTLQLTLSNARTMLGEALSGRDRLVAEAVRLCDERVELHTTLWRERRDELAAALSASREREGPAWYEHPALWFAIGAIAAGALVIGLAAAVGG
jgi:hypothetical protein